MTITGTASEIYQAVSECMRILAQELEDDIPAIRKAYTMRLADERHKSTWEVISQGIRHMTEIHAKLSALGRALSLVPDDAEVALSHEETSLLAAMKTSALPELPKLDLTESA